MCVWGACSLCLSCRQRFALLVKRGVRVQAILHWNSKVRMNLGFCCYIGLSAVCIIFTSQ